MAPSLKSLVRTTLPVVVLSGATVPSAPADEIQSVAAQALALAAKPPAPPQLPQLPADAYTGTTIIIAGVRR